MKPPLFLPLVAALLGLLCCAAAGDAYGFRICPPNPCRDAFLNHALVFSGRALATAPATPEMRAAYDRAKGPGADPQDLLPDTYTDFAPETVYKGAPGAAVRVFYNSGDIDGSPRGVIPPAYPQGSEELVFAGEKHGYFIPGVAACGHCTAESPVLRAIKESYDAADALIAKSPQAAAPYLKKAALQEANGDVAGMRATLDRMPVPPEAAPKMPEAAPKNK